MSAAALAPVLEKHYGTDRIAYHLTADYTWGWTQEESITGGDRGAGLEDGPTTCDAARRGDFSSVPRRRS